MKQTSMCEYQKPSTNSLQIMYYLYKQKTAKNKYQQLFFLKIQIAFVKCHEIFRLSTAHRAITNFYRKEAANSQ